MSDDNEIPEGMYDDDPNNPTPYIDTSKLLKNMHGSVMRPKGPETEENVKELKEAVSTLTTNVNSLIRENRTMRKKYSSLETYCKNLTERVNTLERNVELLRSAYVEHDKFIDEIRFDDKLFKKPRGK